MKRVHDHKEEPTSLTGSPDPANEVHAQRRGGGRKRKATGPTSAEPAAQRQRTTPSSGQTVQGTPQQNVAYQGAAGPVHQIMPGHQIRKAHDRHRLYSQWANQRDLLTRQMEFVQSPEDEANLQRLSQNIEELRRLSQEARRG